MKCKNKNCGKKIEGGKRTADITFGLCEECYNDRTERLLRAIFRDDPIEIIVEEETKPTIH